MSKKVWVPLILCLGLLAAPIFPIPNNPVRQTYGDTVEAKVGGLTAPDGVTQIDCDLPIHFQMKNVGGSDGAGLCVFTSIGHEARWQGVKALEDFQQWMRRYPGGGYPDKVHKKIAEICKEKGVPEPRYLQVEGHDLDILKLACKTGRMPGVTYSYSPTGRYGGQKIAHMVSLPHADDRFFGVLDNNYPCTSESPNQIEWLTHAEFGKTYCGSGNGWAVILLDPGPPPPPRN